MSRVSYNATLTATILRGSHSEDSTPPTFALNDISKEN